MPLLKALVLAGNYSTMGAFEKVNALSKELERRAKELQREGWKVVGYPCPLAPPELLTAAGILPYRLRGNPEVPIVKADICFESNFCPWVRNWLELGLRGQYDWLDGIVMAHSCDAVQRSYGLWREYLKPSFSYLVNLPHAITPQGRQFFREELEEFRRALERFTGVEITEARLTGAIEKYEELRGLVKGLYDKRKHEPPLLSGKEMSKILNVVSSIPVEEGIELIKGIVAEITQRKSLAPSKPRIMVSGSILDNDVLINLIEELGAHVVTDDTCIGTRSFFPRARRPGDPMEDLVRYWLDGFKCPRTYRGDSPERFKYLAQLSQDFAVDGIIIYVYSFCDAHMFDVPDLRDYLSNEGFPTLYLEGDYSKRAIAQMRTRIEAFLEVIS